MGPLVIKRARAEGRQGERGGRRHRAISIRGRVHRTSTLRGIVCWWAHRTYNEDEGGRRAEVTILWQMSYAHAPPSLIAQITVNKIARENE